MSISPDALSVKDSLAAIHELVSKKFATVRINNTTYFLTRNSALVSLLAGNINNVELLPSEREKVRSMFPEIQTKEDLFNMIEKEKVTKHHPFHSRQFYFFK